VRYLVDTMVLSEPGRRAPNEAVIEWLDAQLPLDLAISVLTLGEIARGVERMAKGRRKEALSAWLSADLPAHFGDRVLPIDEPVALAWGALTAESERLGRPLPAIDGLLLATAKVHALTMVTRNVNDFAGRGVPVHNPYT
jgi:toxin FitB